MIMKFYFYPFIELILKMVFIFVFKIVLMCQKSGFDILVCQLAYSLIAVDWGRKTIIQHVHLCVCVCVCLCVCVCRSERLQRKGGGGYKGLSTNPLLPLKTKLKVHSTK